MSKKKTTTEFIAEAKVIHGDFYDYSEAVYDGQRELVKLSCPVHGRFEQRPKTHLRGSGCHECGLMKNHSNQTKTQEQFIIDAKAVHGDRFDYSKAVYKGAHEKITIICDEHGEFEQVPSNHTNAKMGCPSCKYYECSIRNTFSSTQEFIDRAIVVHGDRYDYSKSVYLLSKTNIIITCGVHGDFEQMPNGHLVGNGCSKCATTTPKCELEISEFLDELGVNYKMHDRTKIKPYELDFYFPEHNLAIEHHGLYWHQEDKVGVRYHINKLKMCEEKGIKLLQIFEDEWINRREAIKTIIKGALGLVDRVYARKLTVTYEKPVSQATKDFFETYHHSGNTQANSAVVLTDGDEIVFASSFRKHSNNRKDFIVGEWELARVTSKKRVVGGLSRTLKAFGKVNNVDKMVSFCDLRYFTGSGFDAIGFEHISTTTPTPFYSNNRGERIHQRAFTKTKVEKLFGPCETTALAKMKEQGYWRVFDCGHNKYQLIKK